MLYKPYWMVERGKPAHILPKSATSGKTRENQENRGIWSCVMYGFESRYERKNRKSKLL